MQTVSYNVGPAGRTPTHRSFDLPERQPRRSRSQSRIRGESASAVNDYGRSPSSYSEPQSPVEEPLLAYDMPDVPSLHDFPMPPRLPHPHAPPPGPSSSRPAIFRGSDATPPQRSSLRPNGSSYYDQQQQSSSNPVPTSGGYSNINGRTIHGRTSTDLLSAHGPVPIHFAPGTPGVPSISSPPLPRHVASPEMSAPRSRPPRASVEPSHSESLVPPPQHEDSQSERRSYSDIIAAMETTSSFPLARPSISKETLDVEPTELPLPSSPHHGSVSNHTPSSPAPTSLPANSFTTPPMPPIPSSSSYNRAPSYSDPPTPIPRSGGPNKLVKTPPPSNYRTRPPTALKIDNPSAFAMPRLPIAGTFSVPSSPAYEGGPARNLPAHKSIPNLRGEGGSSSAMAAPRPSFSSSKRSQRTRRSSHSSKRSKSSSYSDNDDDRDEGDEYDADILGDYGVQLSPNWDPSEYPLGLPTPSTFRRAGSSSPSTTTLSSFRRQRTTTMGTTGSGSVDGGAVPLPSPRLLAERQRERRSSQPHGGGTGSGQIMTRRMSEGPSQSSPSASSSSHVSPETSPPTPTTSTAPTSPPSPVRSLSLRHKLSISAIRNNAAARRKHDSVVTERERGRMVSRAQVREETVEVDDMEFTIVGPAILQNGSPISSRGRESEDTSAGIGSSHSPHGSPAIPNDDAQRAAAAHLRNQAISPAPSSSGQTLNMPHDPNHPPSNPLSPPPPSYSSPPQTPLLSPFSTTFDSRASFTTMSEVSHADNRASLDPAAVGSSNAEHHRQLELKWINAMGAVPSAEAYKSKKIQKLVIEGVPASVRGVVWLYLVDNKGRRMPGVYGQLSKRVVANAKEILVDIQSRFPDQSHLCEDGGPLMLVLQAYLSMVPDTIYSYGLALIAGNLLLQTHEEDSFWTFVALMDRHLRGYFSPTAKLLEIDSMLFERAIASSDKILANRLFDNFRITAAEFCSHWFTTLFACALPPSFLPRIWDTIMFFADPTFLFRLGLALVKICRPYLMDASKCRTPDEARNILIKPPVALFPSNPDAIIASALHLKLKEDELRKLRPKLEAQLKQRHPRVASGSNFTRS